MYEKLVIVLDRMSLKLNTTFILFIKMINEMLQSKNFLNSNPCVIYQWDVSFAEDAHLNFSEPAFSSIQLKFSVKLKLHDVKVCRKY